MAGPSMQLDPRDVTRTRSSVMHGLFGTPAERVRVGRYEIVGTLGSGAMGRVYDAVDPSLGRAVAIKMLAEGRDDEVLVREARALARLSHPNVVEVFEVGVDRDEVFVAMERIDGADLRRWLDDHSPSPEQVLEIFLSAARGLAAAHAHGVIHRDFKPDNVLISRDGRVKVADFGLAMSGDSTGDATLRSGSGGASSGRGAGTPSYMAPELLEGGAASIASDQFAYCVSLIEALTGTTARAPAEIPRGVGPRHVRAALERGLSREPRERFADLEVLAEALEPPRRTGLWVAAAVAFCGGVLVAARPTPAPGCDDAPLPSELLREAVQRFDGAISARPELGEPGRERAKSRVGEIVASLDARHVATCEAFAASGAVQAFDVSQTCVTSRTRGLQSTLEALVQDGVSGHFILQALDGLPPVSECETAPPISVELAADVERARTLLLAGRASGRELMLDVRERASSEHDRRVVAMADLALGRAVAGAGNDATDRLQTAYFAALEADDDTTALAAALALADTASRVGRDRRTAEIWVEAAASAQTRTREPADAARVSLFRARLDYDSRLLESGLAHADAALADVPEGRGALRASVLSVRARILGQLGRLDEAQAAFDDARDVLARYYGPEHALVLTAEADLGALAFRQGRFEAGLAHMRRALEGQRALYGDEDIRVATTLNAIGAIEGKLGHLDRAREALEAADPVLRARLGDEHPRVATNLLNLSEVAAREGDVDMAIELRLKCLSIRHAAFGEDSAMVAMTYNALGQLYTTADRAADARATYARVLEIGAATTLPPSVVADAHMGLARAIDDDDRRAAIEHLEMARDLVGRSLGEAHTDYADVSTNLAILRLREGDAEVALSLATDAVATYVDALGEDHPYAVPPRLTASEAALALGRRAEGAAWASQALAHASGEDELRAKELLARARGRSAAGTL